MSKRKADMQEFGSGRGLEVARGARGAYCRRGVPLLTNGGSLVGYNPLSAAAGGRAPSRFAIFPDSISCPHNSLSTRKCWGHDKFSILRVPSKEDHRRAEATYDPLSYLQCPIVHTLNQGERENVRGRERNVNSMRHTILAYQYLQTDIQIIEALTIHAEESQLDTLVRCRISLVFQVENNDPWQYSPQDSSVKSAHLRTPSMMFFRPAEVPPQH